MNGLGDVWPGLRPPGALPPFEALRVLLGELGALGALGTCDLASGGQSLNCAGPGTAASVVPEALKGVHSAYLFAR
eukprot:13087573-Alexandrium_andersonii.AAC.1